MARRAELAVLPGGGQLTQHVFVQVALGVPVVHRNFVQQIDHFGQQPRFFGRQGEAGVFHVGGEGGLLAGHLLHEGEHAFGDGLVHLLGGHVFEAAPAEILGVPFVAIG